MNVTVDTNVLVRVVVGDDVEQARAAERLLHQATLIAVPLPCLCELVWVLRRLYNIEPALIGEAIRVLARTHNVAMNRPAVEMGLAVLNAGGDFADGVMAYEGRWLGGETFVSFDKKAVSLLSNQGIDARMLD